MSRLYAVGLQAQQLVQEIEDLERSGSKEVAITVIATLSFLQQEVPKAIADRID